MRVGLSKQAVQQLLDALVADGVLGRRPDPDDARARLVFFTHKGLKVLADANRVKKRIQSEYRRTLDKAEFSRLVAALDRAIRCVRWRSTNLPVVSIDQDEALFFRTPKVTPDGRDARWPVPHRVPA